MLVVVEAGLNDQREVFFVLCQIQRRIGAPILVGGLGGILDGLAPFLP